MQRNTDNNEFELKSSKDSNKFVKKTIASLLKAIDDYVSKTDRKITELQQKKAILDKKRYKTDDNIASDMAKGLLGALKHGFYSKIDFNEVLGIQKIKIASNLKASLQELITDAPTPDTKPLELLKGVCFLLVLAKEQNQAISSGFTVGTAGELDKLLERQLDAIKNKYPDVLKNAISLKNSLMLL